MPRFVALCLLMTALLGCSSVPESVGPKPEVKTIALVPPALPLDYQFYNLRAVQAALFGVASIPLGLLDESNKDRVKRFALSMPAPDFRIDVELTESIVRSLRSMGYEVTILSNLKRDPTDPENVDIEKVPHTADAVVHAYFRDTGVQSPRMKTDFYPRVSVNLVSFVPKGKAPAKYSTLYYGLDAVPGRGDSIPAEVKYVYPNYEFIMSNIPMLRTNFTVAANQLGGLVAQHLHSRFR